MINPVKTNKLPHQHLPYTGFLPFLVTLLLWGHSTHAQTCSGTVLNISAANPSQTGTPGTWTVPAGGPYKVRITAKGAKGGNSANMMSGGSGATMIGEFIVNTGQTIQAMAGSAGGNGIGSISGGGGGGGSGAQIQNGNLLILSGGGSGGSYFTNGQGGTEQAGNGNGGSSGGGTSDGAGGGGIAGNGANGGANSLGNAPTGGGAGFGAQGGNLRNCSSFSGGNGGGGFSGGGGGNCSLGGGGGGGYSGGNGGSGGVGGGGGSINFGTNQNNTAGANNGGGQVIIECLGAATLSATFTPTQPACATPTQGSLSIDLTGDLNGNTGGGVEYAIVSGNTFTGTPTFADITADPFNLTSGTGTVGAVNGNNYTVRIRLKNNPELFIDRSYTITSQLDSDSDGYGVTCDCNDENSAIHPGATEICNGVDDNCNGQTDEGGVCCPPGNILYVNAAAIGANNGTSWLNAYKTLQQALANSCASVTEIRVAKGTYYPTTGTDRNASFVMKNGVAIYGGFSGTGTETQLSQRNWNTNVTTLSGDIGTIGNSSDNSFRVINNDFSQSNRLTGSAILDGFTITAGNANGNFPLNLGGGIWNNFASPTITNCIFSGNNAVAGGGMYNANSAPAITQCLFVGNSADVGGSGLANGDNTPSIITNCTFYGNTGSAAILTQSNFNATNCIVWGNHSGISGGGTVTYSIVQGGFSGAGNLNVDPLFVDAAGGNFHLQSCSFAIDGGTDTNSPTTDLDNNARVDAIAGGRITDMGLYEYQTVLSGATLYVNRANNGGTYDGTTWATAFKTLQEALIKAGTCITFNQIWVAKGTYYPDEGGSFADNDRNAAFAMRSGLAIYGGFSGNGTETQLSQRNWNTNLTTLSGDIDQNDTSLDSTGNSYHVIRNGNTIDATARLDGFVITAGRADGEAPASGNENNKDGNGGGVSNDGSNGFCNPVFVNCIFRNNNARWGGAVYNYATDGICNPIFTNCSFFNNKAMFRANQVTPYGGAMALIANSKATLTNCTLTGNTADGRGGAIYAGRNGTPELTLTNCILWGNTARISGNQVQNTSAITHTHHTLLQGGVAAISIQGIGTNNDLGGNLSTNPLFVDAANGNLQLQACSPAINAGDNSLIPEGTVVDLAKNDRIYASGTVDMGAYEYQGNAPAAIIPTVTSANPTTCGGTNGSITLSGFLNTAVYSVTYKKNNTTVPAANVTSNGSGVITLANLGAGTYTDMVATYGTCVSIAPTTPVVLTDPAKPTLTIGTIAAICTGATSFSIPYSNPVESPNQYSITGTGITEVVNANLTNPITVQLSSGASGSSIPFTLTVRNSTTNCVSEAITGSVTVNPDQPPTITCPDNQTLVLGANCSVAIGDFTTLATASDNCANPLTITQSPGASTVLNGAGASQIVRLTARDAANRTATCTFIVTAVDRTPPTITCPGDRTLAVGANCLAFLPDYTGLGRATDNCTGSPRITQIPAAGTTLGLGATTVTLTATDGSNRISTCTFTVTVVDETPPNITCPANITVNAAPGQCSAVVTFTAPVGTDNCSSPTTTQTAGIASGGNFPVGVTTNTFRVMAANGQTTECSFTVTVNAVSVGGTVSGDATVCSGTNSTPLTLSGHTGSVQKWQSSLTSNFTNPTDIVHTLSTLTVTNRTQTTYYRAVVQNGECAVAAFSVPAAITVDPVSVGGSLSGSTAFCAGSNSAELTLSGHTGAVQKWQSSLTSDFSSAIDINNTGNTLSPANVTVTTYFRAIIKSGVCNSANSETATITVNPVSVGGSINGAATVCAGTNSTPLTLANHIGTIQKWQSSLTSDFASPTDIANTTTQFTATNLSQTTYYRAVIKSGVCDPANSAPVTVTVNPISVGGTVSGAATVCAGTNSTQLTLSGHIGNVVKWQSSPTSDFAAPTDIINTATQFTATNLPKTTYYRAIVKSGVCDAANSAPVTVTVNPVSVGGSIGGAATVCAGTNSAVLTLSGHTGTIQKWQSSLTFDFANPTDITNTTTQLTATDLTQTTYYHAVVKSGECAAVNSVSATVTVNPLPAATLSASAVVCQHAPAHTLTFTGTLGTAPYTFTYTINNGPELILNATNGNSATLTPSTDTAGTFIYTLVRVSDAHSCAQTVSDADTITILAPLTPTAAVGTVISRGQSATLTANGCSGQGFTLLWYKSSDNTPVTMPVSPTGTASYYARCQQTVGQMSCLSGKTADVTIVVGQRIFVNAANVNATPDGTSWAKAFASLQAALTAARTANYSPIEIWVAQGTYTPGTLRKDVFEIPSGVKVYGGFVGTETEPGQRNWKTNKTILSGEIGSTASLSDNVNHVVVLNATNADTQLDGFTIEKGFADFLNSTQNTELIEPAVLSSGGGILVINKSRGLITNCIVTNNRAIAGGGVLVQDSSKISITQTILWGNEATFGGGVYILGGSMPKLENLLIVSNKALGGGMYFNRSQPQLEHCTIASNQGTNGTAGGIFSANSAAVVRNSIVWGNSSPQTTAGVGISYSIVEGGYAGTNNLNQNPMFVNAGSSGLAPLGGLGDYHLLGCSPAINSGDNVNAPTEDLEGTVRPFGAVVDRGAYESQSVGSAGPATLNVTENIAGGKVLKTAGKITAANQVSGGTVEYRSSESVTLLPGFSAAGATFQATIGGCQTNGQTNSVNDSQK